MGLPLVTTVSILVSEISRVFYTLEGEEDEEGDGVGEMSTFTQLVE